MPLIYSSGFCKFEITNRTNAEVNEKIGIILGSGLNKFVEKLLHPELIYEDTKSFHKIRVFSGIIGSTEIYIFSGRRHFYEGYSLEKVIESIDMAQEMKIKLLIITNAAGGLNSGFKVSDLMLITSHLNFNKNIFSANNGAVLYNKKIINRVKSYAMQENINLRYGSYCCFYGPSYETKAEIRFLNKIGIDAVGMSTIPEILYANKIGIKTLAFSCITNLLHESSSGITKHEEVVEAGKKAYSNFSRLMEKIISKSSEILIDY